MMGELRGTEGKLAEAAQAHEGAARKLRRREDDLVLPRATAHTMPSSPCALRCSVHHTERLLLRVAQVLLLQSYENLRDEHGALQARVDKASDGSAAHVARLHANLSAVEAESQQRGLDVAALTQQADELRDALRMREGQLALMLTHVEADQMEVSSLRSQGGAEEARLRGELREREGHLVALVRELYDLASAEKVPGVVAHETRSRVFRRCAAVYELLGEEAFGQEEEAPHDDAAAAGGPRAVPA